MPRNSKAYRQARLRVEAIWAGDPCNITAEQRRGLYVECGGLVGQFSSRGSYSGGSGDRILGNGSCLLGGPPSSRQPLTG